VQLQTWRAASFGRGADISFGSIAESQPPVELIRFRAKRHREIYWRNSLRGQHLPTNFAIRIFGSMYVDVHLASRQSLGLIFRQRS